MFLAGRLRLHGVHHISFPSRRLHIMARFAESLPVLTIPKQNNVSSMRNNVIDYRCGSNQPASLALGAKRIRPQIRFTRPLPSIIIAALIRRAARLITRLSVILPVLLAPRTGDELPTARMPAGSRRSYRHGYPGLVIIRLLEGGCWVSSRRQDRRGGGIA